jgi:hypothetical protein
VTTHLTGKARATAGPSRQGRAMNTSSETRSGFPRATPGRQPGDERAVRRIRAEFLEMPGLCLTIEQAQRLWSLERRTCEALLTSLVASRFLGRTDRGLFVLRKPRD